MGIAAHLVLLRDQHLDKATLVLRLLQRLERRLLVLGHRATDAVTRALKPADPNAGAWNLAHSIHFLGRIRWVDETAAYFVRISFPARVIRNWYS